jgi:hypothetical protein
LTDLLKKSFRTYEWDKSCNEAIGTLKDIFGQNTYVEVVPLWKGF